MVVGAKVCELTDGFLWFVCGNFYVYPKVYRLPSPAEFPSSYSPLYEQVHYIYSPSGGLLTPMDLLGGQDRVWGVKIG